MCTWNPIIKSVYYSIKFLLRKKRYDTACCDNFCISNFNTLYVRNETTVDYSLYI